MRRESEGRTSDLDRHQLLTPPPRLSPNQIERRQGHIKLQILPIVRMCGEAVVVAPLSLDASSRVDRSVELSLQYAWP
jgi:hypothetical protein